MNLNSLPRFFKDSIVFSWILILIFIVLGPENPSPIPLRHMGCIYFTAPSGIHKSQMISS